MPLEPEMAQPGLEDIEEHKLGRGRSVGYGECSRRKEQHFKALRKEREWCFLRTKTGQEGWATESNVGAGVRWDWIMKSSESSLATSSAGPAYLQQQIPS